MNSVYWGVDSSYYPANEKAKHDRKRTVWEFICEEAAELTLPPMHIPPSVPPLSLSPPPVWAEPAAPGSRKKLTGLGERQPDFWGRYLGNHEITRAEIDYIAKKSDGRCRLLLAYNRASKTIVAGNKDKGLHVAQQAIARAKHVGVPDGTFIYCDVEGEWRPSAEFFEGWFEGMNKSYYGGRGGIYCRTSEQLFVQPYMSAIRKDNPALISEPLFMRRYLWTTRPQVSGRRRPGDYSTFAPIEPLHGGVSLRNTTVIHQYAIEQCHGMVDFNVANQDGYDSMWRLS